MLTAVIVQAPKALYAHSATALGSQILVFGGSSKDECSNELFIFDAGMPLLAPPLFFAY